MPQPESQPAASPVRWPLEIQAERIRKLEAALSAAGERERMLRAQLRRTQGRLRALLDLFTDDKAGAGWRRTPYLADDDLAGFRRCADLLPPSLAPDDQKNLSLLPGRDLLRERRRLVQADRLAIDLIGDAARPEFVAVVMARPDRLAARPARQVVALDLVQAGLAAAPAISDLFQGRPRASF